MALRRWQQCFGDQPTRLRMLATAGTQVCMGWWHLGPDAGPLGVSTALLA